MNIRNIHIMRALAAFLLCVIAVSCSQDELIADHGATLPPGKYPLLLKATIDEMTSRAAESDPWGDGDVIAVQIEDYPAAGKYTLNTDGSVKESEYPLSWPFEKGNVKAWYPYVAVGNTIEKSISNQSQGYHDIDFLNAVSEKEENYKNTVNLRFKHQMAKVSCSLTNGEGVTEADLKTAKVSYHGNTSISFKEGVMAGSGDGWISADTAHTALLVPQDMSGKDFIKVNITLTVNGNEINKTLTYAPKSCELKEGTHYVYNINVRKDSLVVESVNAAWNDKVESGASEIAVFKVNMPKNLPEGSLEWLKFSDNVLNQEKYLAGLENHLEVKGNEFTISYSVSAPFLLKFSIIEGSEIDKAPDNIVNPTEELDFMGDEDYKVYVSLRSREVSLAWDYLLIPDFVTQKNEI